MKVYLAGVYSRPYLVLEKPLYILESYFYAKNAPEFMENIKKHDINFLLDSGAFSFMNKFTADFDVWVEEYANFINKHNIDLFFELDIDSIVGLKEVENLRNKLEKLTNKQCIPVWHKSRGKDYWLKMISDYKYCAIGGIVTKEIKPNEYPFLNWFLSEAKKQNCKVHGLGYTKTTELNKYPFYSIDSTSWLSGSRFAHIYYFENGIINQRQKPKGKKMVNYKIVDKNNFNEWIKFQKYAETNL